MALNSFGKLEVVFSFVDRSKPGTESAAENLKRVGRTAQVAGATTRNAFANAFPALATLSILRQVGHALVGMLRPAFEFESAMRRVAAFGDFGKESFKDFEQEIRSTATTLSVQFGQSAIDVADAFANLSKQGIKGSS